VRGPTPVVLREEQMIKYHYLGPYLRYVVGITGFLLGIASCATDSNQTRIKAEAAMNVGIASLNTGDYGGALKELLRAQQLNPKITRLIIICP